MPSLPIIKSIKSGSCFITNGPCLEFSTSINSKNYMSGSIIKNNSIICDFMNCNYSCSPNSKTSDEISKATGGFGIPGFKWPL